MSHANAHAAPTFDKDQPAVLYVRALIYKYFPAVALHWDSANSVEKQKDGKYHNFRDHPLHGVGGFNRRKTEAGKDSIHGEGRAADIYVAAKNAYLKRFGDELFMRFVANAHVLGVEQVVWNLQIWSQSDRTVRSFVARPHHMKSHEDHLHLQFSRAASQRTPELLETLISDAAKIADEAFQ